MSRWRPHRGSRRYVLFGDESSKIDVTSEAVMQEIVNPVTVICRRCDPIVYMHPDQLDAHNEERHGG